ncbi:MAG: hypothetical protein A2Y40_07685 [Candidatus Margulisbacteria bacterium GWF2_35_9]|nr:MAG: hypothetical protein A2Y40_07685 [Candidatus Margulisbacteria bacterium GWF2_35_9]
MINIVKILLLLLCFGCVFAENIRQAEIDKFINLAIKHVNMYEIQKHRLDVINPDLIATR